MAHSLAQIAAALRAKSGLVSDAAESLGMRANSLHHRIRNNPQLRDVIAEARDRVLDLAESRVEQAIDDGDMTTTRWFLDRRGGERGYNPKMTTESHVSSEPRRVEITFVKSEPPAAAGGSPEETK